MSMLSSVQMRYLAASFSGGRARVPPTMMLNVVARGISIKTGKSQKHLLSEFKGVRGPQSEEVSDGGSMRAVGWGSACQGSLLMTR